MFPSDMYWFLKCVIHVLGRRIINDENEDNNEEDARVGDEYDGDLIN